MNNIGKNKDYELFDYTEKEIQEISEKSKIPSEQKTSAVVEKLKKVAVFNIQPEESAGYAPINLDPDKVSYIKFDYLTDELGMSKELMELAIKEAGNIDKLVAAQELLEKQQFQNALIAKTMTVAEKYQDVNFVVAIADLAPTFTAENLTRFLDDPLLKDAKLRKTLIKGSKIVKDRLTKNISEPQSVKKTSVQEDYPFVIDSKNIIHIEGASVGTGGSKRIFTSLSLQEGEENVIGKIKNPYEDFLLKEVKNEQTILELGQGKKGIAPSYKLTIFKKKRSGSSQVKFLQKKMSGDGSLLFSATSKAQINFMRDIFEGITFLHDHDYVHSDIKFGNFLMDKDGHGYLTDFGVTVKEGDYIIGYTPAYKSPEQNYTGSKEMDLYAAGLCLLRMSNPEQFVQLEFKNQAPVELRGEKNFLNKLSNLELENLMKGCQGEILKNNNEEEKENKLKMFLVASLLLKSKPEERISIKEASALLDKDSTAIREFASNYQKKIDDENKEEVILDESNELERLIEKHDAEKSKKKLTLAEKLRRLWERISTS